MQNRNLGPVVKIGRRTYRFHDRSLAKQAAAAYDRLQAASKPGFKAAALGGDPETSFEQSFASLAYSFIKDKVPRLLDYMVGFQLIDRDDDNTKAVGVFGFKAGNEWMYAPMFFLSGDIKGNELLYLKNKDMFVPLKENWVNYILGKQPYLLGDAEPKQLQQLGVRGPDLTRLSLPPGYSKMAEVMPKAWPEWMAGFAKVAAECELFPTADLKKMDWAGDFTLTKALPQSLPLCKLAFAATQQIPALGEVMDRLYGPDFLQKCAEQLLEKTAAVVDDPILAGRTAPKVETDLLGVPVTKQAVSTKKVTIHLDPNDLTTYNLPEWTEEEQKKMLRDGYLVEDARTGEEVTKVYNTQLAMTLVNPDVTGFYDVLIKPGSFERCLVICNPQSNEGRGDGCVVVRLSSPRNYEVTHRNAVFANPNEQDGSSDKEDWGKWFDGQTSADKLKTNTQYVALTRDGSASYPFRVYRKLGEDLYDVSFDDYVANRPSWAPRRSHGCDSCSGENYRSPSVQLNRKEGTKLKSMRGTLYVPTSAKLITVKDADPESWNQPEDVLEGKKKPNPPVQPGDLADTVLELVQKSAGFKLGSPKDVEALFARETTPMKLISDGIDAWINNVGPLTVKQALFSLILEHGLDEPTAKTLLKKASTKSGLRVRVKYADEYSQMTGPGPTAPPMPGPVYQTSGTWPHMPEVQTQQENLAVPDLASSNYDPRVYDARPEMMPDPMAMQGAQEAAQTGQKEVFDTSMFSGLLRSVRTESVFDRGLPDILRAMTRLGRWLMTFYWKAEMVEDMFAKSELPELEDAIRNSFEDLGDLALQVQERSKSDLRLRDTSPNTDEAAMN